MIPPAMSHKCKQAGCYEIVLDFEYCFRHFTLHGEFSKVRVICGPPGSGKTSYVQQHFARGDLILDHDAIYSALSNLPFYEKPDALLPFVLHARSSILYHLQRKPDDVSGIEHVWIIDCGAQKEDRDKLRWRFHAEVIVFVTPAEVCLRRIEKQGRGGGRDWTSIVGDWWKVYEPSSEDKVIANDRRE
jgi:hypothetical protein